MRFVTAPTFSGQRTTPNLASLEAVRHLGRRFPEARVREVPVLRATDLDESADSTGETRVWLALEALQVTGTIKVRGALVAVAARRDRGHVFAASTGTQGAAVAYAGAVLGVATTIVLPCTAPRSKRDAISRYGSGLVVAPTDRFEDVEEIAREIAATEGAAFVPANDDVDTALGNGASLGFEIVRALGGVPERLLVPLGRGGLTTGLSWSFAAEDPAHQPQLWGAERESAVSAAPLGRSHAAAAGVVAVPNEWIPAAMAHAYRRTGVPLEEHAAIPLAPVLAGLPGPLRGGDLVVVLTGRSTDPARLEAALASALGDRTI